MYNTIIVGYDESEPSKAALKESSLWVKKHGGRLYLVHAVFFNEEEFTNLPAQREQRLELGGKICKTAKQTVLAEDAIEVESLLCEGEPPEVIADVARGKQADLIALGTYGRRGLRRLLMGSVTAEVILKAPCDVLVVKRQCSECTGRYSSLLASFDGSENSRKALQRACELAKADNAVVSVLYVIPRYEEMIEFFKTESIQKSLRREAENIITQAQKIAVESGVNIKTYIREGNAADEVITATETIESDLIIMGTHGWKGFSKAVMGSTTRRVVTHASCPVLVVK
ncbi:MAG TPA: universal stress protein [Nitrospirota bacterium]|nr:universal stress protein [Nitrospirota bacterium]